MKKNIINKLKLNNDDIGYVLYPTIINNNGETLKFSWENGEYTDIVFKFNDEIYDKFSILFKWTKNYEIYDINKEKFIFEIEYFQKNYIYTKPTDIQYLNLNKFLEDLKKASKFAIKNKLKLDLNSN